MATLGGLVAGYIAVDPGRQALLSGRVHPFCCVSRDWKLTLLRCIDNRSLIGGAFSNTATRHPEYFHGLFSWTIFRTPLVSLVLCVRSWEQGWRIYSYGSFSRVLDILIV